MVLKSKKTQKNEKFNFPGKILISKRRLKFWGVTTLPPLRKISSSRFVKSCFKKIYAVKCGYSERAISGVKLQCGLLALCGKNPWFGEDERFLRWI